MQPHDEAAVQVTTTFKQIAEEFQDWYDSWFDFDDEERAALPHLLESVRAIQSLVDAGACAGSVIGLAPIGTVRAIDIENERASSLEVLRRLTDSLRRLDDQILTLQRVQVIRLRQLGASWRQIGEAMGMTQQSIQEKAQRHGWTDDLATS